MNSSDWRGVNLLSRTKQHDGSLRCVSNQRFYRRWTSSQKNISSMFTFYRSRWESKLLCYWKQTLFTGLTQGGLEIPCKILFQGTTQHVAKLKKLSKHFHTTRKSANLDNSDQPAKRIKVEDIANYIFDGVTSSTSSSIAMERATSPDCERWVKLNRRSLSLLDKSIIIQGLWLYMLVQSVFVVHNLPVS